MDKEIKTRESSSRARAMNVANMVIEHLSAGKAKTRETKTRIKEKPVSTENATTV